LPQYNKYVTKTRITEALHAGQVYARKVESEAAGGGSAGTEPTVDLATITRTGSGADTRVNIALDEAIDSQALITSDVAELAGGKVLELAPEGSSGTIRWACRSNLPASKMPKVCTFDDSVGGPVAWKVGTTDKDACWDQDYADGAGRGNGWVEGKNSVGSCEPGECGPEGNPQDAVREDADDGVWEWLGEKDYCV
jgi:hypothetical protein